MIVAFTEDGWHDYLFWQANDLKTLGRINALLADAVRNPFEGIGKPEPLKGSLRGFWSRRITQEHRLVYQVIDQGDRKILVVAQCRFHY